MNPASSPSAVRRIGPLPLIDAVAAALITLVAFIGVYRAADWRPEQYLWSARDVWFDADSSRVVRIETGARGGYNRTLMHPMYPFVAAPSIRAMKFIMSENRAVRLFHAAIGGLWPGLFFLLLRRVGCRRLDAAAFTGVLVSSAAFIFWAPSFETFVLGGISMFPAIALAVGGAGGSWRLHALSGIAAMGITLTNGVAAVFSALTRLPRRRFAAAMAASAGATIAIMVAHTLVFHGSTLLLDHPEHEAAWVFSPESGGPLAILRVFFVSSMVMPEIRHNFNWLEPLFPQMTLQAGPLFSGSPAAWPATVLWLFLLVTGAAALWKAVDNRPLRATLAGIVLYQLLLHLVYGRETFLYAPHFLPVLVIVAAFGARTRLRPYVLAAALALCLANAANNVPPFSRAKAYTMRNLTLNELKNRGLIESEGLETDPAIEYRFWRDLRFFGR